MFNCVAFLLQFFVVNGKVGVCLPVLPHQLGVCDTPNDRLKSVRNRFLIEVYVDVCVLSRCFFIFLWV